MSVENAIKVMQYAAKNINFRASHRNSPHEAIATYKDELGIDANGLTSDEMNNILSFSDDDFASFANLVEQVQPNVSPDDRTSILI